MYRPVCPIESLSRSETSSSSRKGGSGVGLGVHHRGARGKQLHLGDDLILGFAASVFVPSGGGQSLRPRDRLRYSRVFLEGPSSSGGAGAIKYTCVPQSSVVTFGLGRSRNLLQALGGWRLSGSPKLRVYRRRRCCCCACCCCCSATLFTSTALGSGWQTSPRFQE